MRLVCCLLSLLSLPAFVTAQERRPAIQSIAIETGRAAPCVLRGPDAFQQLLVSGKDATGRLWDATRDARFSIAPSDVVTIDATGIVTPLKEGKAIITATADGKTASVEVVVSDMASPPRVSLRDDVVPLLTRLGCNAGGCHGKTGGQNGFQLSLFGFEPGEDYHALARESRGRRVVTAAPEQSLLLRKPSGGMAHSGGKRMPVDSLYYRMLRRWIVQGMPDDPAGAPTVTGIEVLPRERLLARGGAQQLVVIARYSDGSVRDVTRLAQFDVNEKALAEVDANGLVRAKEDVGSVAVMARYQTHIAVFQALIPLDRSAFDAAKAPAPRNVIDEKVAKRWKDLGLAPSAFCDDATFLRRVTLDLAGRLPTVTETKEFLASKEADRHEKLVDRLLASEDYAWHFAGKWSAVLHNRRKSAKDDAAVTKAFHGWIKDRLHENQPFDDWVRELLTVEGTQPEHPQIVWYREVNKVEEQVEDVAQLFLGQRITCARCHHHPLEKWSQDDYWSLAAFFTRVEFKEPPPPKKDKGMKEAPKRPPMTVSFKKGKAEALNPKSGKMLRPAPLGGAALDIAADVDPRERLVDWMVAPDNPYFARVLANRYWKHFMGRGLVEPEDDMRGSNPPSNPELLDALARYLVENHYQLKKLVRLICTSNVYRLSIEPNEHNKTDRQSFSRFQPRRLPAEVLLDSIDDVVLVRTKLKGAPRAVQLPDNQVESYFLSAFGRPDFSSACECERSGDSSLAQSLVLVNSKELLDKISKGRAAQMAKDKASHEEKVRELYLAALSREPTVDETQRIVDYVTRRSANLQAAYEDVIWSVLNTKEFLFNH